jgi:hypothetical protein
VLLVRTSFLKVFCDQGEQFYENLNEPGLTYSPELVSWFHQRDLHYLVFRGQAAVSAQGQVDGGICSGVGSATGSARFSATINTRRRLRTPSPALAGLLLPLTVTV